MGIYFDTLPCGCTMAQGSWETRPGLPWLHERCAAAAAGDLRCVAAYHAQTAASQQQFARSEAEMADLTARTGITRERIAEIRDSK
jgi:hypothetical protein